MNADVVRGLLVLGGALVVPLVLLRCARLCDGRARRILPFVLRRSAWLVWTAVFVFTVSFFLMRAVPGGPFDDGRGLLPQVRSNLEARFGLDRPLPEQYLRALGGLPGFDFGPCLTLRDFTVRDVIIQGLPASVCLGIAALVWTLALGIPIGVIAAVRRGTRLDTGLTALASLGMAVPNFVLAGFLMMPLVFATGWLPAAGLATPAALILPSFCLGAPFAAQVARLMRTGMLEVLGQDWIRMARAKGLPEGRVIFGHALRGALLPVVTFLGPALAGILTGSLVIEQVFAIPGIGTHFVQSALSRDYTLSLGMVMLYTVLVYVLNATADLLHGVLDPRVKPT
jgi:ABC-type dipeptide/oligopeptide/nickel transport system permease component